MITEIPMELAALDYTSVIELTSDSVLKAKFAKVPIAPFWSSVIEEYESFLKKSNTSTITVCVDVAVRIKFFSIYANKKQVSRHIGHYTRYKNLTVKY